MFIEGMSAPDRITGPAACALAKTFPVTADHHRIQGAGCLQGVGKTHVGESIRTAFRHIRACPACRSHYRERRALEMRRG